MSDQCGCDAGAWTAAAAVTQSSPEEDVEKLRQRGNNTFQRGNYSRAADLYKRVITSGIVSAMHLLAESTAAHLISEAWSCAAYEAFSWRAGNEAAEPAGEAGGAWEALQ